MTDAEIATQILEDLKLTKVKYSDWVLKVSQGVYHPTDGSSTQWGLAIAGLKALIGTTPPPPLKTLKGMYANSGSSAWPSIKTETGCNMIIGGADDPALLSVLKSTGSKLWAKAGYWDDPAGQFSMNDSQALALAKSVAAQWPDVVVGWYVADEPTNNAHNRAAIQARATLLKSGLPVETSIAYYDAGSIGQWKGVVDAFALDIYPSRFNWNMALITQLAAAADAAGLRYYNVVGCDGATNYPMPNASQLQTMIDLCKATKQAGWLIYAWDSPGHLLDQPGLLSVIKAA
jgi:hypothetical protein